MSPGLVFFRKPTLPEVALPINYSVVKLSGSQLFYTGAISLVIAATLMLLDLTMIKISLSDTSLSTMTIYPVAFFTLLGLLLMYNGLRPLWKK